MPSTPGPWTTEPGRFWICDVGNNVDDPGVWSAHPVKDGESFPFGEKADDARLIAAAPELRDALRRICNALKTGDYGGAVVIAERTGLPLLERLP